MELSDFADALRIQVRGCRIYGSMLGAAILEHSLADLEAGGIVAELASDWPVAQHPLQAMFPLRLLGSGHRLALSGEAPALASQLPTTGGRADGPKLARIWLDALREHRPVVEEMLTRYPQTNEIGRAAGLAPAFVALARRAGLPLRLYELGASAGLNLGWHRYRYSVGNLHWGDPDAAVHVRVAGEGRTPSLTPGPVEIAAAAGCDIAPIDVTRPDEALRLCAYVWPDQTRRLALIRDAIAEARRSPPRLRRARAGEWIAEQLEVDDGQGVCRVVYHSAFWPYLDPPERDAIRQTIEAAGARATPEAPLAWLRLEHESAPLTLRLRSWPGPDDDRRLAEVHPHGRWVRWLASL